MEQSEGRGQIELQIGECEIVIPTVILGYNGWVCGLLRVCVAGVVVVTENASKQAVELPSYHLAVQRRFTTLPASVMNCWHHSHGKVNNLINTELRQHANLTTSDIFCSYDTYVSIEYRE